MSNKWPTLGSLGSGNSAFQDHHLTKPIDLPPPQSSALINRTLYHHQNNRTNTNESMTGMMLQSRMSRNNNGDAISGGLSEQKMSHANSTT